LFHNHGNEKALRQAALSVKKNAMPRGVNVGNKRFLNDGVPSRAR